MNTRIFFLQKTEKQIPQNFFNFVLLSLMGLYAHANNNNSSFLFYEVAFHIEQLILIFSFKRKKMKSKKTKTFIFCMSPCAYVQAILIPCSPSID